MRLFNLLERFTDGSFLLLCKTLFFLNLDAQMKCSQKRYTNFQSDLDQPLERVAVNWYQKENMLLGGKNYVFVSNISGNQKN